MPFSPEQPHNSYEDQARLAAQRLVEATRNSPLGKKLHEAFEREGIPVESKIEVPMVQQIEEGDGNGCVVACYRMAIQVQGAHDLGQNQIRRILEANVDSTGRGGMLELSRKGARLAGLEEAELLVTPIATAIENGYVAIVAASMGTIYNNQEGGAVHAVLIRGLRYEGNDTYKFIINDPLGKATLMDLEPFFREAFMNPVISVPAHKLPEQSVNSPQRITIRPKAEKQEAEGAGKIRVRSKGTVPPHLRQGVETFTPLRDYRVGQPVWFGKKKATIRYFVHQHNYVCEPDDPNVKAVDIELPDGSIERVTAPEIRPR